MMFRVTPTVQHHDTVDEFLRAAGVFLAAREAENNLLFGICSAIRAVPEAFGPEPPRFAVVADAERVLAASLRTPPHNQVISWVDDEAIEPATDALVDALYAEPLPGVLAPKQVASRFSELWSNRTARAAELDVAERIFRLDRVVAPERPTPGTWRLAEPRDRATLARWIVAFSDEATPNAPPLMDPLAVADRWIAGLGRLAYLWEDDGEVVSVVGAGGETPNGIRIGPVYTPSDRRGRGYASSLTAAASQDQLDRGRRFCFLFTNLANPTSNKIYRAIGYQPVCDVDAYRFADA